MITHAEETIINEKGDTVTVRFPIRFDDIMQEGSDELQNVVQLITGGYRPGVSATG